MPISHSSGQSPRDESARRLAAMRNSPSSAAAFTLPCVIWKYVRSSLLATAARHMESVGYDMYLRLLARLWQRQRASRSRKPQSVRWISRSAPIFRTNGELSQRGYVPKIASVQNSEDEMTAGRIIDATASRPGKWWAYHRSAAEHGGTAGITEINQRGGVMLFYLAHPTPEMIGALSRNTGQSAVGVWGVLSGCQTGGRTAA